MLMKLYTMLSPSSPLHHHRPLHSHSCIRRCPGSGNLVPLAGHSHRLNLQRARRAFCQLLALSATKLPVWRQWPRFWRWYRLKHSRRGWILETSLHNSRSSSVLSHKSREHLSHVATGRLSCLQSHRGLNSLDNPQIRPSKYTLTVCGHGIFRSMCPKSQCL